MRTMSASNASSSRRNTTASAAGARCSPGATAKHPNRDLQARACTIRVSIKFSVHVRDEKEDGVEACERDEIYQSGETHRQSDT